MTISLPRNGDLSSWINTNLKPDIFATLTLKQAIPSDSGGLIKGTRERYEAAYRLFINKVSKRIYGKGWKRFGKCLPNAAMIEGDGLAKRLHLHVSIRTPDHLTYEETVAVVLHEWSACEWARDNVLVGPVIGDCVGYSLKEGPEALLLSAMSF